MQPMGMELMDMISADTAPIGIMGDHLAMKGKWMLSMRVSQMKMQGNVLMLPLTDRFSKLIPTIVLSVFYLGSFYLLSIALQMLPLSVVYSTWSGIGVLLVAVMSYAIYGDIFRWPALLGLFFIVGGVVLVNIYTVSQA